MTSWLLWALLAQVTWPQAGPVIDRYCNRCHRAGQVGPFDFTTYEGAAAYAPEIIRYVKENKMPPWRVKKAAPGLRQDRALPAGPRELLLNWAEGGAKEGGPAVMTKRHPQWDLGEPSLVVSQPREHTVAAEKVVDIVRFEYPVGDTDLIFDALELRPSNRNLLNHAVLYAGQQALTAWAMCDNGLKLPRGVAWRVPAGQKLFVELHYFKRTLRPARDLTRVALYYPKQKPRRWARALELTQPELRIPAGARGQIIRGELQLESGGQLLGMLPVFQLLTTRVKVGLRGRAAQLLELAPFEHHVMASYWWNSGLALGRGAVVEVEAEFDNSTQNPFNPHSTPREVRFAENGLDETFRVWLTLTP
jgi:hypothetical protein